MRISAITETITQTVNKGLFKLRKSSPEILVVTGVIGLIGSGIMACVATTKVNDILDETKDNVDAVHDCLENEEVYQTYTQEQANKDLVTIYAQTAWRFAKLYGPSVILAGLSIGCIFTSNNIHRRRNVALAAAYATIDKGFKEYRSRVVERFGEDVDQELRYNIKAREITETVVDEDGNEQTVTKTVNVAEGYEDTSQYARFFDDGCRGWEDNAELNLAILKGQERYANELLWRRGHLMLNEVYDMLGIPRSTAGQVVGWRYDKKNPTAYGDGYVSFGLDNLKRQTVRDFVNGYEKTVLLDFNVDGYILDDIEFAKFNRM